MALEQVLAVGSSRPPTRHAPEPLPADASSEPPIRPVRSATPARRPASSAPWTDRFAAAASAIVPFGVALARATSAGQWSADLAAVRDIGFVPIGVGGALSTIATQALGFVPLGARAFRGALAPALAIGAAGWLLYAVARDALEVGARAARLGPSRGLRIALATLAALTAGLSPTWQREATIGGGAMLGVALALAALRFALVSRHEMETAPSGAGARPIVASAAALAAAFAENPPAAIGALLACALAIAPLDRSFARVWADRIPPRVVRLGAAIALGVAVLLLVPLALRPRAPHAWLDLGTSLTTTAFATADVDAATPTFAMWLRDIGLAPLALAGVGGALGLVRRSSRSLVAALAALAAVAVLAPAVHAGTLASDSFAAARALGVGAIAIGSALGVRAAVDGLLGLRVPMARSGAVLLVAFDVTLVALGSEEAMSVADRSRAVAAEGWTDAALESLDPSAAVLARSPALVLRLWAARVTRGERPDVVVVPERLLARGGVAHAIVTAEPSTTWALRDVALTDDVSEFALSKLADARPLYLELDPRWQKRVAAHLTISGVWLQYAPQPIGPSDRRLAPTLALGPLHRVLSSLVACDLPDAATTRVLRDLVTAQSNVLSLFGDREAIDAFDQELAAAARAHDAGADKRLLTADVRATEWIPATVASAGATPSPRAEKGAKGRARDR